MDIILRKAVKSDVPVILELIKELAEYEKAPGEVTNTIEELEADGFGDKPLFEVILAELEGQVAGMAFYYISYSTWKGRCLYLEDIIVRKENRGKGIGKMLFDATIKKAKEVNAKRMQWQVLDWNEPAINFYRKYNAELDGEWINARLREEQIKAFK